MHRRHREGETPGLRDNYMYRENVLEEGTEIKTESEIGRWRKKEIERKRTSKSETGILDFQRRSMVLIKHCNITEGLTLVPLL